jgi:hypothetical protein
MSFFRPKSGAPEPRDYQGIVLTEKQIHIINNYLEKVAIGAFSHSYLTELRFLANRTFQKAVRLGDSDKMDQIGPELQAIDHVLHVAFDGTRPKKNLAPDPKHMAYLKYLDDKALEATIAAEESFSKDEDKNLEEEVAEEVADIVDSPITEGPGLTIEGLSADVISAFQPKSQIPQIARLQSRLEDLVYDYRDAVEDNEPPFIQKNILKRIGAAHEQLERAIDQYS